AVGAVPGDARRVLPGKRTGRGRPVRSERPHPWVDSRVCSSGAARNGGRVARRVRGGEPGERRGVSAHRDHSTGCDRDKRNRGAAREGHRAAVGFASFEHWRAGGPAMARRSFWAWGLETDEPTEDARREAAERLSKRFGVSLEPPPIPRVEDLDLRPPRIAVPEALADFCATDPHSRASHAYGKSFRDVIRAFNRDFPNPPDVVARPRNEDEVRQVLEWCSDAGYVAIPYGGGSSVVGGVEPPEESRGIVTIDLGAMDRVLEIDATSRAARIQAGVLGPALEEQLRPHGFTLR